MIDAALIFGLCLVSFVAGYIYAYIRGDVPGRNGE